jgi:hypothetical protein
MPPPHLLSSSCRLDIYGRAEYIHWPAASQTVGAGHSWLKPWATCHSLLGRNLRTRTYACTHRNPCGVVPCKLSRRTAWPKMGSHGCVTANSSVRVHKQAPAHMMTPRTDSPPHRPPPGTQAAPRLCLLPRLHLACSVHLRIHTCWFSGQPRSLQLPPKTGPCSHGPPRGEGGFRQGPAATHCSGSLPLHRRNEDRLPTLTPMLSRCRCTPPVHQAPPPAAVGVPCHAWEPPLALRLHSAGVRQPRHQRRST